MSKIQDVQVIARLPVLPILKQEVKKEKVVTTDIVEIELVPGTSTEWPAAEAGKTMEERLEKRKLMNPMKVLWTNTSKNICYLEKGRTPKKRFKKPVKR